MGKIVLLVPREEMLHQAHNILQEKKYQVEKMQVIKTEEAVVAARQCIADGASIVIARGLQASLIKQYTEIPVVEIVLTAQEMALLVMRAKQIVKKQQPVIAVVGFKNMFCDMSFFDELYGIQLRTYFAQVGAELSDVVVQAMENGADLVIGGDTAVSMAAAAGIPSLFLSMTEDSLRQAFAMAERMEFAMNAERKTAAQMETLLDYSFNGVIRLDREGIVTAVNPLMEEMTGQSQENLKGKAIGAVASQVTPDVVEQVLGEGKEYSLFLEWNRNPVFAVMAPVLYDGQVEGAIITCHRMKQKAAESDASASLDKRAGRNRGKEAAGLPPLVRFEDILQQSAMMKECIRTARLYALSEHPVVLYGEPGTEKRMLAESMHNGSSRMGQPFLDVPCAGLDEGEQRNVIFGERGAAIQCQGGTLLLQDVEELTQANQYRLYQLIRFRACHGNDIASLRKVNVRVMATSSRPLSVLLEEGRLRADLYYLLSGLELPVPPLRCRQEDLRKKIEAAVRDCCQRFSRYHVLTKGALERLYQYSWPGNLFQVESFCERLILTAAKRSIDEIAVGRLLEELYSEPASRGSEDCASGFGVSDLEASSSGMPDLSVSGFGASGLSMSDWKVPGLGMAGSAAELECYVPDRKHWHNEDAQRIGQMLRKFGGNRGKAAEALGISKATLWRHMKKYGIEGKM